MRYELQINEWTSWEADRSFDNEVTAKLYARERFPQNEWRVYDKMAERVTHQHDPSEAFEELAQADLGRFRRVAAWTENHNRRMEQVVARSEAQTQRLNHLRRITAMQRRLRPPRPSGYPPWNFPYDDLCVNTNDKVNWLKEGF